MVGDLIFTAQHARILVRESKFKQAREILKDIECAAMMGESEIFGDCELNPITIDEVTRLGFGVDVSDADKWKIFW